MKSKFFAFFAVLALGLLIGASAYALTGSDLTGDPGFYSDMAGEHLFEEGTVTINPRVLHPEFYRIRNPINPSFFADGDGDGVVNISDDCPGTPEGTYVGAPGCPDADEDGIKDDDDTCDLVRDVTTTCPADDDDDDDVIDSDGDGFADDIDFCVGEAAPDSEDGCPVTADGDGDGDGDGGARISGGNLSDINGEEEGSGVEDIKAGGCSMIGNVTASNAFSAILLALSLIPLGIRRKIK